MDTKHNSDNKTFNRCNRCAKHLLSSRAEYCLMHGSLRDDSIACEDSEPTHSGDMHDMTDALRRGKEQ